MRTNWLSLTVCLLATCAITAEVYAQQARQTGSAAAGAAQATGGAAGAASAGAGGGLGAGSGAGGTTQGLGGTTTQGAGGGGAGGAGLAGNNAAEGFVGAGDTTQFVGGARTSTVNTNTTRQFRGINAAAVPTGGSQQQSANPRQVPVSLSVGFPKPEPYQAVALAADSTVTLTRYLPRRPELIAIDVQFSADGIATLTGLAPTVGVKRLAANLVRLQPGVRSVDNQVELAPLD